MTDSNILRNTDAIQGSEQSAKPRRRDLSMHCDLLAAGFGLNLTKEHIHNKDKVRDQALVVLDPLEQQTISVVIRCSTTNKDLVVTVEPQHFIVFSATRCWHATYGGLKGDRLHAMIMLSDLSGHFKDHILEETKHILLTSHVTDEGALGWVLKEPLKKR